MFAIYDIEGRRFRDTLENLRKVQKIQAAQRVSLLPDGWCRKVGGKLENWRKLLIAKHSERRSTAAERSLRHGTSYSIDVAHSIFR